MKRQRRRTLRRLSKKKGGYTSYQYLIDYIAKKENHNIQGVKYVLDELRGRESYEYRTIEYWRDFLNQLSRNDPYYDEHIKDAIGDLNIALAGLEKNARKEVIGGANSQAILPPTQGFKIAAPVNSDNAWHKIA